MTIVSTTAGQVRGTSTDGVVRFLGVPYAGAERFGLPAPPAPWDDVRDALEFGPIAPQEPGAQFQRADLVQDEDCLSLNVWTPAPDDARRPVMVWIHGGAFRSGSTASPLYDGARLAAEDVVVVTVNYRLGPLGFLAHPDLDGGNWGLHDQIQSLRWVRDNIAAFGGDPDNVTIFGESAGAVSVWLLCASPLASGLFRRAIAQSGAPLATTFKAATRTAERLVEALGVADVRALRDAPVADLLAGQARIDSGRMDAFIPCVDGDLLVTAPAESLTGAPMIVGTNLDEWKLWAPMDPHSRDLDEEHLHKRVEERMGSAADEVIAEIRAVRTDTGLPANPNDLWFAIETERFFRVPALRGVDAQLAIQPETYVYLFTWPSPAMGGWLGACHGLEIAFVFGTHSGGELSAFTGAGPEADALSTAMMQAWVSFARTGDPGWPGYNTTARPTMVFDGASHMEEAPYDGARIVLDRAMS